MTSFLISAAAVAVVLGLMILVHELGHFLMAKWMGVRVDSFAIGFGPRIWGWKRGVTDYRLNALPLGGYVKMAGDNPAEDRAGGPDEFLSKARWQRALIALAGPTMNLIAAVVLASAVYVAGIDQPAFMNQRVVVAQVEKDSAAQKAGIQAGDRVVEFGGLKDPTWGQLLLPLSTTMPGHSIDVVVDRAGKQIPLETKAGTDEFDVVGYPPSPLIVAGVRSGQPAARAGLEAGDRLLAVDGRAVFLPEHFVSAVQAREGKAVDIRVRRDGREMGFQVLPYQGQDSSGKPAWQVGLLVGFATQKKSYGLREAIVHASEFNVRLTGQLLVLVGKLFSGGASVKMLAGPLRIASAAGQAAQRGVVDLVFLTAVISLNLGVLNLLPIPILDGGHLLLLLVEGSLRRDLSMRVKERFVQVGLVFLLVLFAVVMYNDILSLLPR